MASDGKQKTDSSILNMLLLILGALVLIYRRQINTWLDKKFFRSAYRQEEVLQRLIGQIRDCDSEEEVCKLVCKELDSALYPKSLFVCSWKGEHAAPAIVRASESGPVQVPAELGNGVLQLLQACRSTGACVTSYSNGGPSGLMIVPVAVANGKTGGALLLGEKKSEELYTNTDLHLLDAMANAIGVRLETFWLKRKVDEGARERQEVLGRLDPQMTHLLKECPECSSCFDSTEEQCPTDHCELTLPLPVERTIAQRYRLDRRIGSGGMGVVFEATDLSLNRLVCEGHDQ
jgi:hypothetical protein